MTDNQFMTLVNLLVSRNFLDIDDIFATLRVGLRCVDVVSRSQLFTILSACQAALEKAYEQGKFYEFVVDSHIEGKQSEGE